MTGLPDHSEAAPYYFTYIDRIRNTDIFAVLESQFEETISRFAAISEERSLYRYAPDKWSIREVLNHMNDTERVFLFRALWFARGFEGPLASFDQNVSSPAARADQFPLASHVEDFRAVRMSTLSFFRNLPGEAWMRSGVASGNQVSVRALAYIIAGHTAHHAAILDERYR